MPQFSTSSTRWAALQCRNPKAANSFVYCVKTTNIYCRPTCPSRLARRANIVFHDTAAEAEAEGFRACKRCRPELRDGDSDPQKIAAEKACNLVKKERDGTGDRKWSVKALATEVGLTESHFCRIFKKVMGMTVGEYRTFVLAGSAGSLPKPANTDQQHTFHAIQCSGESIPTPNILGKYGYESSLSLTDLDFPELEQNWHRIFGVSPAMNMLNSPRTDLNIIDSDHSSLDHFSDPTNVDMMDDGFQFLNFDILNSAELLN